MKGLFNHLLDGGCFFGFSLGIIGWILSIFGAWYRLHFPLTSRFIRFAIDVYFMVVFSFFFFLKEKEDIYIKFVSGFCPDIFLIFNFNRGSIGQVQVEDKNKCN